jgi:uncharacterized cupredoxin-like copper-binding protein
MAAMSFVPAHVTLKRNKAYRLVLTNPSKVYHNFVATVRRRSGTLRASPAADSPPTALSGVPAARRLLAVDEDWRGWRNRVVRRARTRAAARGVALRARPNAAASRYVVPRKLGLYEFKCTVVGHESMKGVLEVVA